MIDKTAMRGLLKNMERAAEALLLHDPTFHEAMQALRWEIDNDPRVQAAVRGLQATGQNVFSSFIPNIKIRIRTAEGIFSLAKGEGAPAVGSLVHSGPTQELRNAANAVIMKSRYCRELEAIVNEAVAASESFESMASRIERAGCEVLISLDLSAYAHVSESTALAGPIQRNLPAVLPAPAGFQLTKYDRNFLTDLKIKID